MGVRRLQTYLEQHCPEACYQVSIEDIANDYRLKYKREPVIVVDALSCYRRLYTGLDWVCGGQYKEFADKINKFFDSLENIGVRVVIFFDGATQESKRPVWVSRRLEGMKRAHAVFDLLKSGYAVQELQDPNLWTLPPGTGAVFSSISKRRYMARRSIVECDDEIADYAAKNKCFAILSQDSDFVIYQKGAEHYLSIQNLDFETLTTLAYDQKALARHLNLYVSDLPVFASLMGNDHIPADDLRPFHSYLTGRQRHNSYVKVLVRSVADFVRSKPRGPELIPFLQQLSHDVFLDRNRADDLYRSIMSYGRILNDSGREIDERCEKWDKILSIAHANYINMESPSTIYNILRKLPYELSSALEDCRTSMLPSAVVLRPMRQRIYGVALRDYPGGSEMDFIVNEWCMSGPQSLNSAFKVMPIFPPVDSPDLLELWTNSSNSIKIKEAKYKLLAWICSENLSSKNLSSYPNEIIFAICILSYLYHDAGILYDWEVRVLATVVVDVQAMNPKELSTIAVSRVNIRGVQVATLFTRAISHLILVNALCGNPVLQGQHHQLFDGKLFQRLYLMGETTALIPKYGNTGHFYQLCEAVLS